MNCESICPTRIQNFTYPGADITASGFSFVRREREIDGTAGRTGVCNSEASIFCFFTRLDGAALTGSGGVSDLWSRTTTLRFREG